MPLWFLTQIVLVVTAVLAVGTTIGRRLAAGALVATSLALPWAAPAAPVPRTLLCFLGLVAVVKSTQIATSRGPWPMWRRIWHGLVPFDVRQARLTKPAIDWPLTAIVLLYGLVAGGALIALSATADVPQQWRSPCRFLIGAVLVFAWLGATSDLIRLIHRFFGIVVPPIQRAPLLARSVGDFWGTRWNRPWRDWLHELAFLPLARRHYFAAAVLAPFFVSGIMHAWLVLPALDIKAAATMGSFFLVQGFVVSAELSIGVRRWHPLAARSWTLSLLLLTSPLFVSPFLRVLGY